MSDAQQQLGFSDEEIELETFLPICKVDAPQRLFTAVALAPWDGDPETAEASGDTQGDVVTAEEIEAAMVQFMKDLAAGDSFLAVMHADEPAPLVLIENWQARIDMVLGEETIKAGTWLMTLFTADDELWARIESGELDGLSVRGEGVRTEV